MRFCRPESESRRGPFSSRAAGISFRTNGKRVPVTGDGGPAVTPTDIRMLRSPASDAPGDFFEGPVARVSLFLARLLLSCAAAFAAGFAIIVASAPLARIEPAWMGEALEAAIVAVAWTLAGLAVAGRHASRIAPTIFLLGAAMAWMLARGIVHTVSPYYGLLSFATACAAAAAIWSVHGRRERSRSLRAIPVLLPITVVVIFFLNALLRAPIGIDGAVGDDSVKVQLPVAPIGAETQRLYVWSKRSAALPARPDGIVPIELDGDSGPSYYRVTEIVDSTRIRSACDALRAVPASLVDTEIHAGRTPAVMRILPIRYRECESGRIWLAEPSGS